MVAWPVRAGTNVQPSRGSGRRRGSSSGASHSAGRRCTRRSTSSLAPSARTAATATWTTRRRRLRATTRRRARARRRAATRRAPPIAKRDDRLEQHVPAARQEERRQEVPVEPALVRAASATAERARRRSSATAISAAAARDRVLGQDGRDERRGIGSSGCERDMLASRCLREVVVMSSSRASCTARPAAAAGSPVGVERLRPARAQAARLRRGRDRRRPRHPARRRGHARSAAAPALSRARDRRAASRRSLPPARRRAAPHALDAPNDALQRRRRCPAATGSTTCASKDEPDHRLLAFLHVAEKAAAGRFAIYRELVDDDPPTRAIFEEILRDEVFHMNYTYTQLARISPRLVPAAGVAGARAAGCGSAICASRPRSPALIGTRSSRSCISSCCRRSRGWPSGPSGASRRAGRRSRATADESPTSQY